MWKPTSLILFLLGVLVGPSSALEIGSSASATSRMAPMGEDWDFYPLRVDNQPASIYLNLGIAQAAPVSTLPNMVYVRVKMRQPREDGLSSNEEFQTLSNLEDALRQRGSITECPTWDSCRRRLARDQASSPKDGHAMMTKEERKEIIAILSDDQTSVQRNTLSRRVGDLRHEIVIFHRSVSRQHYLELKISTLAGEVLFMGRFDSVFHEHDDTFVDAFSARVPEETRKHRCRQLLMVLRDQVRPFLNSLASIADLHSCMASRLEGRGLVSEKLRSAT